MIPDGATIMFGGFLGCGSAHKIIDALSKSGKSGFTIIGNDCGMATGPDGDLYGMAKLVHNKQVKRVIATHVGMTPDVATQNMVDKTLEVNLIPQGSLAEMIRAGGAGLGGVLTPVGIDTLVEESPFCLGRHTVDGKEDVYKRQVHDPAEDRQDPGHPQGYRPRGHRRQCHPVRVRSVCQEAL